MLANLLSGCLFAGCVSYRPDACEIDGRVRDEFGRCLDAAVPDLTERDLTTVSDGNTKD
jgi:hypothetical protein